MSNDQRDKYSYKRIPGEHRFHIGSKSSPKLPYTVDLLQNNGNGACSCTDFSTRCYPNFKANGGNIVPYGAYGNPDKERTQCKHIDIARRGYMDEIIQLVLQKQREQEETNRRAKAVGSNTYR